MVDSYFLLHLVISQIIYNLLLFWHFKAGTIIKWEKMSRQVYTHPLSLRSTPSKYVSVKLPCTNDPSSPACSKQIQLYSSITRLIWITIAKWILKWIDCKRKMLRVNLSNQSWYHSWLELQFILDLRYILPQCFWLMLVAPLHQCFRGFSTENLERTNEC